MLTRDPTEPQKARFTSTNNIVKDHYYYRGNDFVWNKACAMTDKYYQYYHKGQNEHKERIEQQQAQEIQDKQFVHQMRNDQIMDMKQETRARYEQRVRENALIARKANQPARSLPELSEDQLEQETFNVIAKKIDASKHLRSNEISWNHLHKASKKYVDQAIRPISIEREEELIKGFQKKIRNENKVEAEKEGQRTKTHTAIRKIFLNKHEENFEREKKLNLLPKLNKTTIHGSINSLARNNREVGVPSIHIFEDDEQSTTQAPERVINYPTPSMGPSLNTIDGEFRLKYPTSLPSLDESRTKSVRSAIIDKLAEPRKEVKKDLNLEYSELNGMLIKNMDYKVYHPGNVFYDTLTTNNKFFQDTMVENREARVRPSINNITNTSRTTRPSHIYTEASEFGGAPSRASKGLLSQRIPQTTHAKSLNNIQKDEVHDDIDAFEKRMPIAKTFGYPKVELMNINTTLTPLHQKMFP